MEDVKQDTNKIENPDNTGNNRDEKGKFLPGFSGNPEGKPKGTLSLISILKELLSGIVEEGDTGIKKEKARAMMEIYLDKALNQKDKEVIKDIMNRIDGMPKQDIKLGVDEIITKLTLEIVKPKEDGIKNTINDSIGEESGGIQKQEE